jgi:hypothetical protein
VERIKRVPLSQPGTFVVMANVKGVGRKNLDFALGKIAAPIIELNFPERQYRT